MVVCTCIVITDAYDKYMEDNNFDAILMPPVALPAPPHGMIGVYIYLYVYLYMACNENVHMNMRNYDD